MVRDDYGYNLVKEFEGSNLNIASLGVAEGIKDLYSMSKTINDETMFTPRSTAFVNLSEATKTARYFEKHKVYTKADPVYDKYEFNSFWDAEEEKRKNGITIPGELYKDKDGVFKLRNIHITGEHYGYLNYARIRRVPEETLLADTAQDGHDILTSTSQAVQTASADKDVTFPDFWDSDYYYFHAIALARLVGKHLVVGKARRKGYSYKNGWICANRSDLYPNTVTAIAAYDAKSMYPKGTFSMADDYLQWIFDHTDWSKRRLRDSKEGFIKFGYKLQNSPSVERGYKSVLLAEPFGPAQPGALRGKDADLIIVEEAGKARNLADFLESTLPTLKAGKFVTGLMIVFGTGGGDENFWEDFEDLFYDPDTSDFMCFENIFDKDVEGEGCGYFVPDHNNKEGFYDKHGNSHVSTAIDYEIDIRRKLKSKGKVKKLRDRSMEYCFRPSEAFSRGSGNIFNAELINQQITRIKRDPLLRNIGRQGNLVYKTEGGVAFKDHKFMNENELKYFHPPVKDIRLKPGKDNEGCFVQYQRPFTQDGKVPSKLYRIWHDPFGISKDKKDLTGKHSFGCIYIWERANNITPTKGQRLVGVYIGRPESTDTVNEILYKLSVLYNAEILYEKNVGDTYNWFRQKKELHRLTSTPKSIFDKDSNTLSKTDEKGIHINEQRKINGAIYLKDLIEQKVAQDDHGNWKRVIHYIYDIPFLQELLKWSLTGNFDRVSTFIVGMFDIREQYFVEVQPAKVQTDPDSFFNREHF